MSLEEVLTDGGSLEFFNGQIFRAFHFDQLFRVFANIGSFGVFV
jgi:hypothetical protein